MKEDVKHSLIGAILTFFVTIILQYFVLLIGGDDGKIILINNKLVDDKYQTIIALKNMNSNEYLKDVEIKLSDDIEICSVSLNGKQLEENSNILFDVVNPNSSSTIIIISMQDIEKGDLTVIKNDNVISIEEFNKTENYNNINRRLLQTFGKFFQNNTVCRSIGFSVFFAVAYHFSVITGKVFRKRFF